jgi:hypothetical protein
MPAVVQARVETESLPVGIAHQLDRATGVAVAVWDGEITPSDIAEHLASIEANEGWGTATAYLTDFRTVAPSSAPSDDAVRALAEEFRARLRARMRSARWALVAGGLLEQLVTFETLVGNGSSSIATFSRLETGCAWIGANHERTRDLVRQLRDQLRAAESPLR